jgi:hypothetical protein
MSAWVNFILGNGYRSGKLTKIKFKELLMLRLTSLKEEMFNLTREKR